MTNKQLNRYYETLKKMNIESLKSLTNNGKIYILTTKEQVADFLLACKIEGINSRGYQCPDIHKTELPVFVAVATFEYNVFFILHSHDYRGVTRLKILLNWKKQKNRWKQHSMNIQKMTSHTHFQITCLDTFMKRNRRPSYLIQRIFQL